MIETSEPDFKADIYYYEDEPKKEFIDRVSYDRMKRVAIELAKAVGKISSCNKNDDRAPKENKGPNSKDYWHWQEEQSRNIAADAINRAKDILGGE